MEIQTINSKTRKKMCIALQYRHLSADMKMKSYEIKTSFVSLEGGRRSGRTKLVLIIFFKFNIYGKLFVIRC